MQLSARILVLIVCFILKDIQTVPVDNVGANSLYPAAEIVPGRPLLIKNYPAVENYQSDLYEVYSEPYNFKMARQNKCYYKTWLSDKITEFILNDQDIRPLSAVAIIQSEGENTINGEFFFLQRHPPAGPVFVKGNLTGLTEGKHGVHIHQAGDLREGCAKLGPHFNPFLLQHGAPSDHVRHVGDLGNIEADNEGKAEINFIDPLMSLTGGPRGIVGRAIVITENPDDLGRGGTANSLSNGNSGKPLACGIIAYVN